LDRDLFLEQLKSALNEICDPGRTIEMLQECPTSDLVLRTPCHITFFAVVERAESLTKVSQKAQEEVVRARSTKGAEWPRDLNLVLLVRGDKAPDYVSIRQLVDDRYVCRKFVLNFNGGDIRDILADLPFWPPDDLLTKAPTSVVAGVQEVVKGYDTRLITDLASHSPGVERVVEKIQQDVYSLSGEPSLSEAVIPARVVPSVLTRFEALDITDFRGIRHLRPEDMPLSGNVIFIYGPNGVGKTSIADAVEWAITGRISRLEQAPSHSARGELDPIVNVFSDKHEARVTCRLSNCEPVCRTKRGRSTERLIGHHKAIDDRAVIDHVVGTKAPSGEARLGIGRLRDLFRGSHMLSQHDIRQFLQRTKPGERFDILTNMIGAEEYVRFREKVAVVLRHLRSQVAAITEQSKSINRELEDVSKRLHERQKDFERLSHAVTSGKTPEDLASELLKGLRNYQCAIDEAGAERANAGPMEQWFELIAVQAETAIRSKKAATEDLLVRLESLEQELQGYVESQTRCKSLAGEIASEKNVSDKARADLQNQEKVRQDIQNRLLLLRKKQSEATRSYTGLAWLKEKLTAYRQSRQTLRRVEDYLTGQREELHQSEAALGEQRKSLTLKRARLQEIEQKIAAKTSREQMLLTLLRRLPQVEARRQEVEQLTNREKQVDSQIAELKRQVSLACGEVNETRANVDALQRTYNSEAARHDLLSSFLARLAELVNSAECPLCGQRFESTEEAKANIQKHLSAVPLLLRELARRLDEAKKDANVKETQAGSITARIRTLEAEFGQVLSNKAAAAKAVQDFLAECAALAVTVSVDSVVSWQKALEQALKECEVASLHSEASSLRDEINALASLVVNQQSMVDELRQKLTQNEKEHSQLVTAVQGLEADAVQRGFEPSSLPQDDSLLTELLKSQGEVKECSESVAQRETELRVVESAITELREGIRRADENIASKETQLRHYETTCSRFAASCRAIGVGPENPGENIHSVKRKALELNQSLFGLEEKRQVLQQILGLGKLKREVDNLTRNEGDIKRQAEASSQKELRLRDWVSNFEKLETEVIRRQVDVVGTHLKGLEPTIQRLSQRLNPHPIFGKVRIRVDEKTRELDVEAEASVGRERLGNIAVSPSDFFSDAQMNSLAITVFLAGALRQRWSGFNTILIDDPVQQMDEMNVYAFLDLIRGLSGQWQFIIFTCSRDFYLLALDKLVCLNKSKHESFLAYRLEGIAPAELKVYRDAP
jgi:DNA repair exonuclease SbcCD ATPase subunit